MDSEVLILGGGVAGLATAAALAEAGVQCVVAEAAEAFGTHSSAQNAAILRTLMSSKVLTRLGRTSARVMFDPPPAFARPLIQSCGLLLMADHADAPALAAWQAAAGEVDFSPTVPQTARDIRARAPHVKHPDADRFGAEEFAGLWLPREGVIDIAALMLGFAKQATQHGATLLTRATALEVSRLGARWSVRLKDGRTLTAEQIVIAGGAWAQTLGRQVGSTLDFAPRRRHLVVATLGDTPLDLPVVWNHSTSGRMFYTRPEVPGLLMCACDEALIEPTTTADLASCQKDPAVLEAVAAMTEEFMPAWANARVQSYWAGWRTFATADAQRFVIGADPDVDGLFWSAGLGGHGMTAAFEVGRLGAKAITDARGLRAPQLDGDPYDEAFAPRHVVART